ncbi:MAG TPA: M20 family metallopeptidase [Kineosporiaceae bacterium]|nr:M20 family metallopeptidase [Kineosporiaceae bacterium]
MTPAPDLVDDAHALAGELADLRHRLHAEPELGLVLPRTQKKVLAALDGLPLEVTSGTSSTAVTAVLRGGAGRGGEPPDLHVGGQPVVRPRDVPGVPPHTRGGSSRPVVLLRGDMDALPVEEQVDVPFRSRIPGVMHACGHDLHTAMLVGAARVLAARREALAGDVVFMFQPGEEGHDGARHMIEDGVLDAAGARPVAAYALHVMSNLTPRGAIASRPGPLMAASDGLFVTVTGRGGHGSTPHLARDPVVAACDMVTSLQVAMTRSIDAFAPHVLTVGAIHGGTKRNIVPDVVTFEATVRTFDRAVRSVLIDTAQRVCEGVAAAHGVDVEVRYEAEYPVTVNDEAEAAFALGVAEDLFGRGAVVRMPNPITGSEDFSRILAEVPGAMLFLGALVDGREPATAPSNHSPLAAFDDAVLPQGTSLYAALAARRLAQP